MVTSPATDWLETAKKQDGSWWPEWTNWLEQYSGDAKAIANINLNKFSEIYSAPGEYVIEQ